MVSFVSKIVVVKVNGLQNGSSVNLLRIGIGISLIKPVMGFDSISMYLTIKPVMGFDSISMHFTKEVQT